MPRTRALVAFAAAAMLIVTSAGPASAAPAPANCANATVAGGRLVVPKTPAVVDLDACRVRAGIVVEHDGLSVVLPDPGKGVAINVLGRGAPERSLSVRRTHSGEQIEVFTPTATTASPPSPPDGRAVLPACQDSAYNPSGRLNVDGFYPQFNASDAPDSISEFDALESWSLGAYYFTGGINDCGLAEHRFTARWDYLGETDDHANIRDGVAGCLSPDGRDIVDFGRRPDPAMATTCYWYSAGLPGGNDWIDEADMRFDNVSTKWYSFWDAPGDSEVPAGCTDAYDILGSMVHEMGHAFGFDHVDETQHPHLTMSEAVGECDSSERTLGLGDYRLLELGYS